MESNDGKGDPVEGESRVLECYLSPRGVPRYPHTRYNLSLGVVGSLLELEMWLGDQFVNWNIYT